MKLLKKYIQLHQKQNQQESNIMVEFSVNRKMFNKFLKCISVGLVEANLEVLSSRLHIRGKDSANICIVDVTYFDEFNVVDEGNFMIDINKLNNILHKATDETVYFKTNKQKLLIECGKLNAELVLYKNNSKPVPDINIPVSVDIDLNSSQFANAINSINKLAEKLTIITTNEQVTITITNNDDCYEWGIDMINVNGSCDNIITSSYPYDYISEMGNVISMFDSFNLKYGNDIPFIIKCCDDNFEVEYILAPRIVSGD